MGRFPDDVALQTIREVAVGGEIMTRLKASEL